jgi:hypothetical protein
MVAAETGRGAIRARPVPGRFGFGVVPVLALVYQFTELMSLAVVLAWSLAVGRAVAWRGGQGD